MKKKVISKHTTSGDSDSQRTRPYQPPTILSRERLESAANVCTGFGLKNLDETAPGGGICGQVGTKS